MGAAKPLDACIDEASYDSFHNLTCLLFHMIMSPRDGTCSPDGPGHRPPRPPPDPAAGRAAAVAAAARVLHDAGTSDQQDMKNRDGSCNDDTDVYCTIRVHASYAGAAAGRQAGQSEPRPAFAGAVLADATAVEYD